MVSEGCERCYAMRQAHRFSGVGQPYEGLTELGPHGPRWTGKIRLIPELLDGPLRWKKPRRVFVNSMSDLFHEEVPNQFIDQVFAVMAIAKQHSFQLLTKRPRRMLAYFRSLRECPSRRLYESIRGMFQYTGHTGQLGPEDTIPTHLRLPLPNVWLGVSVEDQQTADERIPILLQTPAAVRWISAEPLLGPVDLRRLAFAHYLNMPVINKIDWVVIGGESGPRARPCDLSWIRTITDQCRTENVPVFTKQLGSRPYVVDGSRTAQEWGADGATAIMDDCGGIHCKDTKGGDMAEWPNDLRVREWPR